MTNRNEEALMTMVGSTIVAFYNDYCGFVDAAPVKKFADKKTAVQRTAAALDAAGMEFDQFCQLRPVEAAKSGHKEWSEEMQSRPKINPADDEQHEADSAHIQDEAEEREAEEADEEAKRRTSVDRQPTLKGRRLSVVGGVDAVNPFREGSKSHETFALVQANYGKTYEELREMGARMRAITHSVKQGWMRAL